MNFIEFNGKKIWYFRENGEIFIIVSSVCEALNVDYEHQRRFINDDPILGPAPCIYTVQVPGDTQKRKHFCIPEEYVYGWILQIRSDSPALLEYKKDCYHVLYCHFHKIVVKQSELYKELSKAKNTIRNFKNKISSIEGYAEYINAEMRYARLWKQLKGEIAGAGLFDDEKF